MMEMNQARSVYYSVLSLLFMSEAAQKSFESLVSLLGAIEDTGFDGEACKSAARLKTRLEEGGFDEMNREFFDLFLTPFGGGISMNASVYHDGLEAGKPLLAVKEALNISALRKNNFSEHEDNFGFMFALMAKLCANTDTASVIAAGNIYREVIAPYAPRFVDRLKNCETAVIYKDAAVLLERFLVYEEEFYAAMKKL